MMTATEIRKDARNHLKNKWGKGALIILCYFLIEFAINMVSSLTEEFAILNLLISIATLVISVPLSYGIIISFMKLKRDEEIKAFDFLTLGFSSFSKAWKVAFSMFIKLIVPFILTVISMAVFMIGISLIIASISSSISSSEIATLFSSGIITTMIGLILLIISSIYAYIKQLHYVLSYNIAYDEPDLTSKEIVLKSKTLMTGNRKNYFILTLSFIGWSLLAVLTLGIGYFWLLPYIQVSNICFYDNLKNNNKNNEEDSKA